MRHALNETVGMRNRRKRTAVNSGENSMYRVSVRSKSDGWVIEKIKNKIIKKMMYVYTHYMTYTYALPPDWETDELVESLSLAAG